jgi:hypothetical protein
VDQEEEIQIILELQDQEILRQHHLHKVIQGEVQEIILIIKEEEVEQEQQDKILLIQDLLLVQLQVHKVELVHL